jgi:tryptophanyl-tRNA synthetase
MPASRALTGIQPSGTVHLGNYLGMIRPALELQDRGETFYFVADLHALTSFRDAELIRQTSREIAAIFLALGLDPARSVLWRQSAVPDVCELSWILSCFTPVGQLERGHAVKAAREGGREASAGLLYYPVLQTADILLYDANVVPVGQDQRQHIEVARDTALRLNHHLGEGTLVVPEVLIREAVGVVPGLDGRKMSKSYGNVIPLMEPSKRLRKAVMSIVTDSRGVDEPKDPETCTVFRLYAQVAAPAEVEALREKYLAGGYGYGHAKQDLFVALDALLSTPREAFAGWMSRPADLDDVLAAGAQRARQVARATLGRLHDRLGLA